MSTIYELFYGLNFWLEKTDRPPDHYRPLQADQVKGLFFQVYVPSREISAHEKVIILRKKGSNLLSVNSGIIRAFLARLNITGFILAK